MFETDADRLEYVTSLGDAVTLGIGAASWETTAVFDNEYVDVGGIESRNPILFCRLVDIYQPDLPATIDFRATFAAYNGNDYRVVQVQDDGTGMVTLVLELL